MSCERSGAGVVSYYGLLYVVGGYDGKEGLSTVEYFDPKVDVWTLLPFCMMTANSCPGVTLIDRPSCLGRNHSHLQAENKAQL
ncbi:hypothetical protein DPMN_040684 [Dreissena polymorpha]|uniref:Uncharacterized protein n=2 Tax=Dreissena polymorpha TaxID=45954 RepID=A0A9D4HTB6_DREPO|nr:hypothetical protein DPMN_040684 [Dreissena polymorpha]